MTNEKYKGHALIQKTVCVGFLTKDDDKYNGRVQQFYGEGANTSAKAIQLKASSAISRDGV